MRRNFARLSACAIAIGAASPALAQAPQWLVLGPKVKPFEQVMLDAHNRERAAVGVAPLRWDPALASAAAAYARQLAATGRWQHSSESSRPGQGENLWSGTRGVFTAQRMVADWASEKRLLRSRLLLPAASRTGNWGDVGHYTQMVWRETTKVGCALHSSGRDDFLVCRYNPGGNVPGGRIF